MIFAALPVKFILYVLRSVFLYATIDHHCFSLVGLGPRCGLCKYPASGGKSSVASSGRPKGAMCLDIF